ncbi:CidA/LrgA family protein [Paenibacillus sp. 1011MAR3C5]|uniref:CidA/LrgA family protein n=1 Tax=Paenibacillus sp. 1011MAR3C5 TaxID=1675787 RepID=UPI000E6BAB23|nr:CidA/LrgA family protein [Paenibacillus sp. 1011MAR3C5]RJE90892.1 CidA/LrgA family protein [Paenibacillus sp. 1011MAR3C5]
MRGFAIFIAFYLIGLALEKGLSIPLPANVIGLGLLACALFLGWIKLEWVEASSKIAIRHMGLLFAPAIVGTMVITKQIQSEWLAIGSSIVIGTLVTMLATGLAIKLWPDRREQRDASGSHSA